MRTMNSNNCAISVLRVAAVTVLSALGFSAHAAAPGITGTGTVATFNLTAQANYLTQPDGASVYSWGYGCRTTPATTQFVPALTALPGNTQVTPACSTMQVPGPTLIVNQGAAVTIQLTNNLPVSAGNTSILLPGFTVATSGGVTGLLTQEAQPSGGTVTYTFTASTPGTHAYYSGTQGDLQVEMGLYGAIIVLPTAQPLAANGGACPNKNNAATVNTAGTALVATGERDYRLTTNGAYGVHQACYDREYLFQFSEMDPNIHTQALAQVNACTPAGVPIAGCHLNVPTEPYRPAYFMINGRSMPDNMDPNYAPQYPHQPYNGNPHMHPGDNTLLRIIGTGRWQHPFHEHGNHVRILARDGNLILAPDGASLAGPLLFTTTTTPGLAFDGIFYWTAKGLNWDAYGHNPTSSDPNAKLLCTPDANGYNTLGSAYQQINYYEWCQDHNKPLQEKPFGDVAGGGPTTLPDPNLFTNGPWFGGSPYLGPNATLRATGCSAGAPAGSCGATGSTPPSGTIANSPSGEAGFAFMWHSHNEREITTNNIFPGGMLMMMLVDSREFVINESN